MNGGVGQALDQAVAFWRAPALLAAARQRPLPDDVLEVVRIAAGDAAAAGQGAEATGTQPAEVTEAAAFYLQQLLFAPDSDSYRTLGVNPDAPDTRIKEHYRWLVRWLHPDRNPDEWEAHYADRVNRAWQDLRTPEKREAYDATREPVGGASAPIDPVGGASSPMPSTVGAPSGAKPFTPIPPRHTEPLLSATTTRRLPYYVLGSFGALAGALLTLMWYAQQRPLPTHAVGGDSSAPAPVGGASAPIPDATNLPPVGAPSGATPPPSPTVATAPTPEPLPLPPPPDEPRVAQPAPVPAPVTEPAPARTIAAEAAPTTAAATPARPPVGAPSGANNEAAPPQTAEPPQEAFAAEAAPTTQPQQSPPISEPAAEALLARYTQAYASGDLPTLMRLFTRDATTNRGGRDTIAYDYQQLFEQSRKRQINLQTQGWLHTAGRTTVLARFETQVTPDGALFARRSEGDIRFDLGWEEGELRIRGIRHVER